MIEDIVHLMSCLAGAGYTELRNLPIMELHRVQSASDKIQASYAKAIEVT